MKQYLEAFFIKKSGDMIINHSELNHGNEEIDICVVYAQTYTRGDTTPSTFGQ
jgi:hypothetical protein